MCVRIKIVSSHRVIIVGIYRGHRSCFFPGTKETRSRVLFSITTIAKPPRFPTGIPPCPIDRHANNALKIGYGKGTTVAKNSSILPCVCNAITRANVSEHARVIVTADEISPPEINILEDTVQRVATPVLQRFDLPPGGCCFDSLRSAYTRVVV